MQAMLIFAQDDGDSLPSGTHGGRLHVRYRLMDGTHPAAGAQITETFAIKKDPYNVGGSIRRGTYRTDRQGIFDDSIGFAARQELPDDFELEANQEIKANGDLVAKNLVRWTANRVSVRATDGRRPANVAAPVTLH